MYISCPLQQRPSTHPIQPLMHVMRQPVQPLGGDLPRGSSDHGGNGGRSLHRHSLVSDRHLSVQDESVARGVGGLVSASVTSLESALVTAPSALVTASVVGGGGGSDDEDAGGVDHVGVVTRPDSMVAAVVVSVGGAGGADGTVGRDYAARPFQDDLFVGVGGARRQEGGCDDDLFGKGLECSIKCNCSMCSFNLKIWKTKYFFEILLLKQIRRELHV